LLIARLKAEKGNCSLATDYACPLNGMSREGSLREEAASAKQHGRQVV